jgi:hypothetical protein
LGHANPFHVLKWNENRQHPASFFFRNDEKRTHTHTLFSFLLPITAWLNLVDTATDGLNADHTQSGGIDAKRGRVLFMLCDSPCQWPATSVRPRALGVMMTPYDIRYQRCILCVCHVCCEHNWTESNEKIDRTALFMQA